jgi:hypothetical protein
VRHDGVFRAKHASVLCAQLQLSHGQGVLSVDQKHMRVCALGAAISTAALLLWAFTHDMMPPSWS